MRTIIINNNVNLANPVPRSFFLFHFPSFSRENRKFLHFHHRKSVFTPTALNSTCEAFSLPSSASYGGWDDRGLLTDSSDPGESDQFRGFLNSLGVNDKKYVFTFTLGLVCALAITRVRVSSIIVFPASVLVFAVGFSFGFLRGGDFSRIGSKRRSNDEITRFESDKLTNLIEVLDGFDVEVGDFKSDVQKSIDSSRITVNELESYVNRIESIRLWGLDARKIVQASIENAGHDSSVVIENQKPSKRRKEPDHVRFEFLDFMGGLFREKPVGLKHTTTNNSVKQEISENVENGRNDDNILSSSTGKRSTNSLLYENSSFKSYVGEEDDRRIKNDFEDQKLSSELPGKSARKFTSNKEYMYENNSLHFINNRVSLKMRHNDEPRIRDLNRETEASFIQEEILKKSSRSYQSSSDMDNFSDESYDSRFINQNEKFEDSKFTDDILFNEYLAEANNLLREAKGYIKVRNNEQNVDIILRKSAELLSSAISLKPMSLLAVGQLGNTHLLHGELKLRTSRELRSRLSRSYFMDKRGSQDLFLNKDKLASSLINVCEECEELLVKAGRNYKVALSIDGSDVRALYNWGLALSFRAQLIADIGPKAALEADKVYMAAIDKFDAMLSKGNVNAPEALCRWGMTLQQRSQLRPNNSKDKLKLLQQAKRLYEDALDMDADNLQVRQALSSCMSELRFRKG